VTLCNKTGVVSGRSAKFNTTPVSTEPVTPKLWVYLHLCRTLIVLCGLWGVLFSCGVMCSVIVGCHCVVHHAVWVVGCVVLVQCDAWYCCVVRHTVWVVGCIVLAWCIVLYHCTMLMLCEMLSSCHLLYHLLLCCLSSLCYALCHVSI